MHDRAPKCFISGPEFRHPNEYRCGLPEYKGINTFGRQLSLNHKHLEINGRLMTSPYYAYAVNPNRKSELPAMSLAYIEVAGMYVGSGVELLTFCFRDWGYNPFLPSREVPINSCVLLVMPCR